MLTTFWMLAFFLLGIPLFACGLAAVFDRFDIWMSNVRARRHALRTFRGDH